MQGVTPANWSYTEYANLPGQIGKDGEGLQEAAKQFESLFINMWLKSAREANAAIAKDGVFSGNEMALQQEMFDSQMAMHLAKEGGIGLAPTIMRQLGGQPNVSSPPAVAQTLNQTGLGQQPKPENLAQPASPANVDKSPSPDISLTNQQGGRRALFPDPQGFVEAIAPRIKKIVSRVGIPPLAVMAQAALETGWGQAVIENGQGQSSHNLFGLKATNWQGPAVQIHSKEFLLGQWQDKLDGFRAYSDWDSGISDYVETLSSSSRYAPAVQQQLPAAEFAEYLQKAGYATDPQYAAKLKNIMHRLVGMGF